MLGRERELQELGFVVDSAGKGSLTTAVIEGVPGIGKTTLVETALERVRSERFRVLHGRTDEFLQDRPLYAFLDALGEDLGSRNGTEGGPGSDPGYLAIESVFERLEALASQGPLVLAVEDLQWADPLTIRAIGSLQRRLSDHPIALVVTCRPLPRPDELGRLIDRLTGIRRGLRIPLGPLDDAEILALAEEQLEARVGPKLRQQLLSAGGNPLFVRELLGALRDEGAISIADGTAETRGRTLPSDLKLTILSRLSFLSQETIEVLKLAAVIGRHFTSTDLTAVSGRSAGEMVAALLEACATGILGETDDRLEFRHSLIRDVLYEDMPVALRKQLHVEVARKLRVSGAPIEDIARHFALGATVGDAEAVASMRAAAHELHRRSSALAADMLQRAVPLLPQDDPERIETETELVQALAWAGKPAEAETIANEILPRVVDRGAAVKLRLGLAGSYRIRGRASEALAQLEDALRLAGADRSTSPELLADLSLTRLLTGDFRGAHEEATAALALAEKEGDTYAECETLCVLALLSNWQADVPEAVTLADRAVSVAERDPTGRAGLAHPWGFRGIVLTYADRPDEGLASERHEQRIAQETGTIWGLPLAHFSAGLAAYSAGLLDEAASEAETSLALADELDIRAAALAAHSLLALIALHRGNLFQADAMLEAADEEAAVPGAVQINMQFALLARGLLFAAREEHREAFATLANTFDLVRMVGAVIDHVMIGPPLVRTALRVGERERARSVVAAVEEAAATARTPTARAAALRCRALVHKDVDASMSAVEELRGGPRRIERAEGCEEAAELLAAASRSQEAAEILEEALTIYEEIGASRDLARVEATLRGLGVRKRRKVQPREARTGWTSLTQAELQIARLAAEGLTNRQIGAELFVSARTVETHLSHVYAKLGIRGRAQLAAEVARRS